MAMEQWKKYLAIAGAVLILFILWDAANYRYEMSWAQERVELFHREPWGAGPAELMVDIPGKGYAMGAPKDPAIQGGLAIQLYRPLRDRAAQKLGFRMAIEVIRHHEGGVAFVIREVTDPQKIPSWAREAVFVLEGRTFLATLEGVVCGMEQEAIQALWDHILQVEAEQKWAPTIRNALTAP